LILKRQFFADVVLLLRACFENGIFFPGGGTPPELAGEDACATYRGPLAGDFWGISPPAISIFKTFVQRATCGHETE